MTAFKKPPLSVEKLLAKLEGQGLVVNARADALAYLQHVGAFRLKGYWFHLVDPVTRAFRPGVEFSDLVARYEFDREFRARAFKAIERLEIAVRSAISNQLAMRHGSHWYLKLDIFQPSGKWSYGSLLKKIEDEVGRSRKRAYVEKYFQTYSSPYMPPSWVVTECVTFGFWSSTYAVLADPNDRKAISKKFGIDVTEVFESWLHAIAYFRNVVAHHDRLLRLKPVIGPNNYKQAAIKFTDNKTVFAIATAMNYMLIGTGLPHSWRTDLEELFRNFPAVPPSELGFPPNWNALAGW